MELLKADAAARGKLELAAMYGELAAKSTLSDRARKLHDIQRKAKKQDKA